MIRRIENSKLSLAFDCEINNVVELYNKATGDNYIKAVPDRSIFSLWCIKKGGSRREKFVPSRPAACSSVQDGGKVGLELIYNGLTGEETDLKADIKLTASLLEERNSVEWRIQIGNNHAGYDIVEVLFPHIKGIYLGGTWKDDIMIYPHHAGEKTLNPVEEYTSDRYMNFWRANTRLEEGTYCREINYCGLASMMWMYYYDQRNGLYISSDDKDFLVTGMRAETGGLSNPWMGFGIRKYVRIKAGEVWDSNPYQTAVTCEDWHWGAKEYRKWIEPFIEVDNNPSYLKEEYVLNQCYNFKKDGKIYNRFEKIPGMFDKGKQEYGMRHMFIASWNRRGFDCNYPEYYPDMELGTSMDLYEGCKYVNEHGGFVTFYINARIFDIASDFFPTLGQAMAIKKADGDNIYEEYGPVRFAVMCPSDRAWQKHLTDTACWMVKSYGATGIYLDQLGSAEPFPCYDDRHTHENPGEFNRGYLHIVKNLKEKLAELRPGTFLMIENCGDIYGSYIWGSLTWNGAPYDEYFNVFKYTFPEYTQVNMVNPVIGEEGNARVERFYKNMERALVLGSVLWLGATYKFTGEDVALAEFAKKAVEFRGKLNISISAGRYLDDEGIVSCSRGLNVSRWSLAGGDDLFIVGNLETPADGYLEALVHGRPKCVIFEDVDGNCGIPEFTAKDGSLKIKLPQSRISYVKISY